METSKDRSKVPLKLKDVSLKPTETHTADKTCRHCHTRFYFRPQADPQPDFCTIKCARKWHTKEKQNAIARKERALMAASVYDTPLTPQETAQIRNRVATHVKDQIEIANKVVTGEPGPGGKPIRWTPVQARIFTTMLSKVLPDLNHKHIQHEHKSVDLTELSREELEALASGAAKASDRIKDDFIDVTPEESPDPKTEDS